LGFGAMDGLNSAYPHLANLLLASSCFDLPAFLGTSLMGRTLILPPVRDPAMRDRDPANL